MEQELKIKISVDPQTGKIQIVNKALDLTIKSADQAAKSTNNLKNAIDLLAHTTQPLVGLRGEGGGDNPPITSNGAGPMQLTHADREKIKEIIGKVIMGLGRQ